MYIRYYNITLYEPPPYVVVSRSSSLAKLLITAYYCSRLFAEIFNRIIRILFEEQMGLCAGPGKSEDTVQASACRGNQVARVCNL